MTWVGLNRRDLAAQLQDARDARDHLDRVIAWLEQGLELLGAPARERDHEPLGEPPAGDAAVPQRAIEAATPAPPDVPMDVPTDVSTAPPAPPAPPARSSPEADLRSDAADSAPQKSARGESPRSAPAGSARADQRDRDAKVLSAVISANRRVAKRDVVAALDLTTPQIEASLKRLVEAGRIVATGEKSLRRYSAAPHEWHSQKRAKVEEGTARNARKLTDAVGRVGLRDRIMKAVAADPAALDNNRLALALDADLEDVAEATSWLVGKDRLQMAEDGTYLRSVAEAAREVAAA
jgi:predicted transcriptional regulator